MPKPEKSEFVKIDRGGYFLSLTVSGYHIHTISKSSSRSKRPISGFRHSGRVDASTSGRNLGLKYHQSEALEKLHSKNHRATTNTPRAFQILRSEARACASPVQVGVGSDLTLKSDSSYQN